MTTNPLKDEQHICPYCCKCFTLKRNLTKHLKLVHKILKTSTLKNGLHCPLNCNPQFISKKYAELRHHITKHHGIKLEYEERIFKSREEFTAWKQKVEEQWTCSYKTDTSPKQLLFGRRVTYFTCHRSGIPHLNATKKKKLKNRGSCKLGSHCPSTMTVLEDEDKVQVRFHKTHVGHTLDVKHLTLTKQERAMLAGKIRNGESFGEILQDIKKGFADGKTLTRIQLLTQKDLHSIQIDFKIIIRKNDQNENSVDHASTASNKNVTVSENGNVVFKCCKKIVDTSENLQCAAECVNIVSDIEEMTDSEIKALLDDLICDSCDNTKNERLMDDLYSDMFQSEGNKSAAEENGALLTDINSDLADIEEILRNVCGENVDRPDSGDVSLAPSLHRSESPINCGNRTALRDIKTASFLKISESDGVLESAVPATQMNGLSCGVLHDLTPTNSEAMIALPPIKTVLLSGMPQTDDMASSGVGNVNLVDDTNENHFNVLQNTGIRDTDEQSLLRATGTGTNEMFESVLEMNISGENNFAAGLDDLLPNTEQLKSQEKILLADVESLILSDSTMQGDCFEGSKSAIAYNDLCCNLFDNDKERKLQRRVSLPSQLIESNALAEPSTEISISKESASVTDISDAVCGTINTKQQGKLHDSGTDLICEVREDDSNRTKSQIDQINFDLLENVSQNVSLSLSNVESDVISELVMGIPEVTIDNISGSNKLAQRTVISEAQFDFIPSGTKRKPRYILPKSDVIVPSSEIGDTEIHASNSVQHKTTSSSEGSLTLSVPDKRSVIAGNSKLMMKGVHSCNNNESLKQIGTPHVIPTIQRKNVFCNDLNLTNDSEQSFTTVEVDLHDFPLVLRSIKNHGTTDTVQEICPCIRKRMSNAKPHEGSTLLPKPTSEETSRKFFSEDVKVSHKTENIHVILWKCDRERKRSRPASRATSGKKNTK